MVKRLLQPQLFSDQPYIPTTRILDRSLVEEVGYDSRDVPYRLNLNYKITPEGFVHCHRFRQIDDELLRQHHRRIVRQYVPESLTLHLFRYLRALTVTTMNQVLVNAGYYPAMYRVLVEFSAYVDPTAIPCEVRGYGSLFGAHDFAVIRPAGQEWDFGANSDEIGHNPHQFLVLAWRPH